MENWLITGGCGFIGRSLIFHLLDTKRDVRIRVLDNESVGVRADLATVDANWVPLSDNRSWGRSVEFIHGDVTNIGDVTMAAEMANVIVHLAANTGVGPSVESPQLDLVSNVVGTFNVLEVVRAFKEKPKVIFASSGAPLGAQNPPLHEEMAAKPMSPYGASKLAGEAYCSAYFHSFGVKTTCLRFGNVYGPGSGHKSSVVAKFIRAALEGSNWELYGDGRQTRDYIFILDLVNAIIAAADGDVGGETFQIATARETSLLELVESLGNVLEECGVTKPEVTFSTARIGDSPRNFSLTKKAEELLGWRAKMPLREGLRLTVEQFLSDIEG